jgi:hypothetical protein
MSSPLEYAEVSKVYNYTESLPEYTIVLPSDSETSIIFNCPEYGPDDITVEYEIFDETTNKITVTGEIVDNGIIEDALEGSPVNLEDLLESLLLEDPTVMNKFKYVARVPSDFELTTVIMQNGQLIVSLKREGSPS